MRNCRFAIPAALDPTKDVNPFAARLRGQRQSGRARPTHTAKAGTSSTATPARSSCSARPARPCAPARQLDAHKTCSDNVCGTAAIKVETKPRAVLYLLDSSASRISCTDGGFGCLMVPDSAVARRHHVLGDRAARARRVAGGAHQRRRRLWAAVFPEQDRRRTSRARSRARPRSRPRTAPRSPS